MLLLLLAFPEQPRHIAGLGDLGKINLRANLGSGLLPGGGRSIFRRKMPPDLFSFIRLDGTRVRFLLCYAEFQQNIQDSFALDFQLPGQIIDSNFHPLCVSSKHPVKRS